MSIKLLTDSCCDLQHSFLDENNIDMIALMYTIEGNEYYDDFRISMSAKEFYDKIRNGAVSKTSLINTQRYNDFFVKHLEAGEDIVYIAFSSALSGSYQSAVISANELRERYPQRRIAVIDSRCASMGEGLLVSIAAQKLEEKPSFNEFIKYIEDTKPKICHWFTVDDLQYLYRGGRVSSFSAALGTMLSIKPILHVDDNGRLVPTSKEKGRNASLIAIINEMESSIKDQGKNQTVMISHGDSIDDANKVADMIKKKFPNIKDIVINMIGPVIGSHAGPGTIAIFYLGSKR